ncbi:unnamed protein product [Linum tenue]|uniref:Uncharacterized protein n=1 Tax=Linum tenue TaxID=586396 RepID=A0AAV0N4V8_9ROSI|nr:unnamed protein product [Linum tenue]
MRAIITFQGQQVEYSSNAVNGGSPACLIVDGCKKLIDKNLLIADRSLICGTVWGRAGHSLFCAVNAHVNFQSIYTLRNQRSMAKLGVIVFLMALIIAISMLQTLVMASHGHGGHHYNNKLRVPVAV